MELLWPSLRFCPHCGVPLTPADLAADTVPASGFEDTDDRSLLRYRAGFGWPHIIASLRRRNAPDPLSSTREAARAHA